MTKEELNEVIKLCTKKEEKGQELFFKHFYGKMMAVCSRYARDRDEAQDILQDAFMKVFDNLQKYEVTGSIEGWVRRIFVNTAIDHYRKQKNKFNIEEDGRIEDEDSYYNELEENDSVYSKIKPTDITDAMEQLSPAYKMVFNLYAIENYTHQEVAEILDINIGTSKSNYAKAKQKVREILEKKFHLV
ncbi:RNA polymerase sigma factor [Flavobacteriales bacterium]|nr:RNA polymerase sigma factor [Flavobacteriales bacterium]